MKNKKKGVVKRILKHYEIIKRGTFDTDLLFSVYSQKNANKQEFPVFYGLDQLVFFYMNHRGEE